MRYHGHLAASGYCRLVSIQFNPLRAARGFSSAPWRNERPSLVVSASVYAVQNELARGIGLTRRMLRGLLSREFAEIAAYGLFTSMWYFQAIVHAQMGKIESVWQVRKGVRIVRCKRLSVDLKPNGLFA
jgi:hypothetical protein